jgi:hypothetical protein
LFKGLFAPAFQGIAILVLLSVDLVVIVDYAVNLAGSFIIMRAMV